MKDKTFYDFIDLLERLTWQIYVEKRNEAALHFLNSLIKLEKEKK